MKNDQYKSKKEVLLEIRDVLKRGNISSGVMIPRNRKHVVFEDAVMLLENAHFILKVDDILKVARFLLGVDG